MERTSSEKLFGQIRDCTKLALRLAHSERRPFGPECRKDGIGRGQALVLRILAESDGLSQMELAEKLDIRPSSLGELVAKLAENGYVERRPNENDRRVMNVFLTDKGREAEKAFSDPRQQMADRWCAGLTEEEKNQLNELLGKLVVSMQDALEKSGGPFDEPPFGQGPHGKGHRGPLHMGHFHHEPFCGAHGFRPGEGPRGLWF